MIDTLIEKIEQKKNPTVVGLDTSFDYLPDDLRAGVQDFKGVAEAVVAFNKKIVDAVADIVPAVKVQIAYYEMYGVEGLRAFAETCRYAKSKGLIVMADAKRNDIGATAECYAKAYLGETAVGECGYTAFDSDFLTVNGYLGSDGIKPFLGWMQKRDKGIFVLVKTSNKSSGELQDLKLENGKTVYEYMGALVEEWGKGCIGRYGYSDVGAVVGATHPVQAEILRREMPHTFFLIPGYGAQGGTADDLKVCFDKNGRGGIVNSSRGILCAYKQEKYKGLSFDDAARKACEDMKADLNRAILG